MLAIAFAATPLVNEGLASNYGGFGTAGTIADAPLRIKALALQPDGKLVAVGVREQTFVVARYTSAGELDRSFGAAGVVTTPLLPDQQRAEVVAAAHRPDAAERLETLLLRYTRSGALDHGFGEQGVVAVDLGPNGLPTALALRDDGAFALVGCDENFASPPVALFKPDGAFDRSFGTGGKAELAFGERTCTQDVVFSSRRLLAGGFAGQGTTVSFALAAYDTGEPRALGFAPAQATVPESAMTAMLTVRLSQTAAQTVTVQYAATGGSAINGQDFTLAPGTLIFAPGQTAQRIPIALANDTADEPDETVVITLNSPNNAVLGTNASFTLTITDAGGTEPPSAPYRMYLPLVQR